MKRGRPRLRCALVVVLALGASAPTISLHAADAKAAASAPVELPPMLVEESVSGVPWLYVNAGGTEFLSRCSATTTREFVAAWLAQLQLVHAIVPEELLERTDVPDVFVLYAQDLEHAMSAEIQRELQSAPAGGERGRRGNDAPRNDGVNIAPNMRLTDRDMHASIAYIDETLFDADALSISPSHVRYLLQRRSPELPAWLIEGVERTLRTMDFVEYPVTLHPLIWNNPTESDGLAGDAARPRGVLTADELFAPDAARAAESRHPRHLETRASTQGLFVRWAIASGGATRAAFWKFAARSAEEPVTEAMFESSFGFDFAELRDRLSDYLPKAVNEETWLDPGKLPDPPKFEVERATPEQIARVRGEWDRLAIGYVQRRLPQVREPYVAQARRTLHRAYDTGDRDPRLLAAMGLCEIDAGNEAAARPFLEQATALGVVRPRAYYELARIRFADLRRGAAETKTFSFPELAPVIEPLRRAMKQAPALPEVFTLLGEAWARCDLAPNAEEIDELKTGAHLFARQPTVAYPVALALAHHGKKSEAAAVLNACAGSTVDDNTRAGMTRLRAELGQ